MKPKIHLLGIVNLTDDSYYAPSRVQGEEALVERVGKMVKEGSPGFSLIKVLPI